MISEFTLQALQLLIRYGNFVHCLPFEWCKEQRNIKSLETNTEKWRLFRAVVVIHILLRILLIVICLTAILIENKGVVEVLLALLFLSVFVLTLAFLFEVLFLHQEVVETLNATLSVNFMMGQQLFTYTTCTYL
jgi:hypothetical protein